jgi:hypothetical protein
LRVPLSPRPRIGGGVTPEEARRRRLISDADRVRGYMVAVIADARRADAQVPVGVTASVEVWRAWADRLRDWADQTP